MAYRLPAHLHRNRHGVLYFRLAVPADLRPTFGQAEIYRSLNTSSVRQAADAAQTLRIELWAIFRECHTNYVRRRKNVACRFAAPEGRNDLRQAEAKAPGQAR